MGSLSAGKSVPLASSTCSKVVVGGISLGNEGAVIREFLTGNEIILGRQVGGSLQVTELFLVGTERVRGK